MNVYRTILPLAFATCLVTACRGGAGGSAGRSCSTLSGSASEASASATFSSGFAWEPSADELAIAFLSRAPSAADRSRAVSSDTLFGSGVKDPYVVLRFHFRAGGNDALSYNVDFGNFSKPLTSISRGGAAGNPDGVLELTRESGHVKGAQEFFGKKLDWDLTFRCAR